MPVSLAAMDECLHDEEERVYRDLASDIMDQGDLEFNQFEVGLPVLSRLSRLLRSQYIDQSKASPRRLRPRPPK